jgi:hypothetical protein
MKHAPYGEPSKSLPSDRPWVCEQDNYLAEDIPTARRKSGYT